MDYISSRRSKKLLCAICCTVYFTSYLTRLDYGALLNEIITTGALDRGAAAAVSTGAFVAYGTGQIVYGLLGDRLNPRHIITVGLVCTAGCNVLMYFTTSAAAMLVIWCLNGFFQAMLWPPLLRTVAELVSGRTYTKTVEALHYASALGNVAVYIVAAGFISLSAWRVTFLVCAATAIAAAVFWNAGLAVIPESVKLSGRRTRAAEPGASNAAPSLSFSRWMLLFVPTSIIIVMQGMLRDGLATWTPGYMTEVLGFDASVSAVISTLLPVFGILGVRAAAVVFRRTGDEFTGMLIFELIACGMHLLMVPFYDSAVAMAPLMAISYGCMSSINIMMLSYLPMRFAAMGRTSTVTGIINAFAYVGSALSVYGIAVLSELADWRVTVVMWLCAAAVGAVVCEYCRRVRLVDKIFAPKTEKPATKR